MPLNHFKYMLDTEYRSVVLIDQELHLDISGLVKTLKILLKDYQEDQRDIVYMEMLTDKIMEHFEAKDEVGNIHEIVIKNRAYISSALVHIFSKVSKLDYTKYFNEGNILIELNIKKKISNYEIDLSALFYLNGETVYIASSSLYENTTTSDVIIKNH